jgi:hypothetical protein
VLRYHYQKEHSALDITTHLYSRYDNSAALLYVIAIAIAAAAAVEAVVAHIALADCAVS